MKEFHVPVLLSEVLAGLHPERGQSYLDLTAGYGGHARVILDVTQNYKNSVLVDRDKFAIEQLHREFPPELDIRHQDFCSAMLQLLSCGNTFDLILADFGVSSPQLDMESRGFSYHQDGPLDMRMDQNQTLTAAKLVNTLSKSELADLLVRFGEISPNRARMLASAIVQNRPLTTTRQLAELILSKSRSSRTHPAAPVFQALRIAVNGELDQIEQALPLLPKLLNPNGRVALITFHSLEDRLVKQYFKQASSLGEESPLTILTKKPIVAGAVELVNNPRARSAKLRVAMRNC